MFHLENEKGVGGVGKWIQDDATRNRRGREDKGNEACQGNLRRPGGRLVPGLEAPWALGSYPHCEDREKEKLSEGRAESRPEK